MGRFRLVPAAAFAVLAVLSLPAVAAAKKPTRPPSTVSAYGLNSLSAEWLADSPLGLDDLGRMGGAKIGMYRARFRQDQVLSNGTYSNWTRLDNLTKQASLRGVTLVPVLMNLPGETYAPPRTATERDQFGSFAAAAARRYGPKGSFWSSCGCPWRPVRVWEVWNEPNMAPYWSPPSAAEYAGLLGVVRSSLRAADSGARIMFGGLAYGSYDGVNRINPNTFLRDVIQAAGVNSFDALAIHDYHSTASSGVTAVGGTVSVLKQYAGTDASGAPRQQVWINEFGKATALDDPATPDVDESAQSEVTQRNWLDTFADGVLANRAAWNLGPLFWYSVRDDKNPNAAWLRLGLRRTTADDADGGPKLAWDDYVGRSSVASDVPLPVVR